MLLGRTIVLGVVDDVRTKIMEAGNFYIPDLKLEKVRI